MINRGHYTATQNKEPFKFHLFRHIVDPDSTMLVKDIGADSMRLYKRIMLGLPKNYTKSPMYRDTPISELIQRADKGLIPEADRIAPRTLGNHFIQVGGFINWLAKNEYHQNPAITGLLRISVTRQEHENRDPFSKADIKKIFNPDTYLNEGLTRGPNGDHPSRFWIPLLGLFTGARLEELAQLSLSDIVAVDREEGTAREVFPASGVAALVLPVTTATIMKEIEENGETLCLFIRGGQDKNIKTQSSKRYVPVSPLLVNELGFLEYLAGVHGRSLPEKRGVGGTKVGKSSVVCGNRQVFPDLSKWSAKDRFSKATSNWFKGYRKNIGLARGLDGVMPPINQAAFKGVFFLFLSAPSWTLCGVFQPRAECR